MMKKLTIGQRIIAGFAAIVLISATLGIFSVKQLRTIATLSTVTTSASLEGMDSVGRIETRAHENNLELLKFLMTKNEDLRQEKASNVGTNLQEIASWTAGYQKTKTTPEELSAFVDFEKACQDYANNVRDVIKLSREEK